MMQDDNAPTHLDPSKLGTKEYWDELYAAELTNHADNPADEGTVWFDDADAEAKMVAFLNAPEHRDRFGLDPSTASVLDLGCGNGSLLFALRYGHDHGDEDEDDDDNENEGEGLGESEVRWRGRLLGVDYSERSVQLARQVGRSRSRRGVKDMVTDGEGEGEGEGEGDVEFKVWDVLRGELDDVRATASSIPGGTTSASAGWDVVLDKGTFDAVSLSGELDAQGRRVCERYGERVLQLLRDGGLFLVTSCNWTEKELRGWFEDRTAGSETGARLRLAGRIEYPSFSFGGVKGQTISTLCFQKVAA